MSDNSYATRQDLSDLRAHVDERFSQIDARFDQVIEATRDMLRAFHGWARPTEIKLRTHQDGLAAHE